MFYKEVQPGVFISNEQTIHYKLDKCPCCGATEVMTHRKYADRCIECGNTYNMYTVMRNKRINQKLTRTTTRSYYKLLTDLVDKHEMGHKVPTTLDEELSAIEAEIANIEALERLEHASRSYVTVKCEYCGDEMHVPLGSVNTTYRCNTCDKYYKRYRELYKAAGKLTVAECDEFAQYIMYYIDKSKAGYHTPQLSRGISRLQARVDELGGMHYKFYGRDE